MKYYSKSLPIKDDEYNDLIELKLALEKTLGKPITMRNVVRAMIKFVKNKKEDQEFIKEVKNAIGELGELEVKKEEKVEEKSGLLQKISKKILK